MELDKAPQEIGGDWCRELQPGQPYFAVWYHQPGVNLPEIETLVYLGATKLDVESDSDAATYFFQTARSFQEIGDWTQVPESQRSELSANSQIMSYDQGAVTGIADIDGLLVLLGGLRERMKRGLGWDRILPEDI